MKMLLCLILSAFLLACSSIGLESNLDGYGMSVEVEDWNEEGSWQHFILESYNTKKGVRPFKKNYDKLVLSSFIKQGDGDFIYFDIQDSLSSCLNENIVTKANKVSESINATKPLSDKFDYTIRVSLVRDESFNYKVRKSKSSLTNLHFFYPVSSCDKITKSMSRSSSMAIHELGHLYFFLYGLYEKHTVPENEFWATKIAYCSVLTNPNFKSIRVSNVKLTDEDKQVIKSEDVESGSDGAMLGYKMAHAELFSIARKEKITISNPNMERIKEWCKNIP